MPPTDDAVDKMAGDAPVKAKVGKRQKRGKRKPKALKGAPAFAHTVFVGQLPFGVKEEQVTLLFSRACSGPVNVRMLTDKHTGKSRGMCFVDLGDPAALEEALLLHKANFRGRRINVEPTRAGGANSMARQEHLKRLKSEHVNDHTTKVEALVATYVEDQAYDFQSNDIDEGVKEFLTTISIPKAQGCIEEFAKMDKQKIDNRSAYFMGVIKRIVSGVDVRGT